MLYTVNHVCYTVTTLRDITQWSSNIFPTRAGGSRASAAAALAGLGSRKKLSKNKIGDLCLKGRE